MYIIPNQFFILFNWFSLNELNTITTQKVGTHDLLRYVNSMNKNFTCDSINFEILVETAWEYQRGW